MSNECNELYQMLRSVSMGELREYFEKLKELNSKVYEELEKHIKDNPPKFYKCTN